MNGSGEIAFLAEIIVATAISGGDSSKRDFQKPIDFLRHISCELDTDRSQNCKISPSPSPDAIQTFHRNPFCRGVCFYRILERSNSASEWFFHHAGCGTTLRSDPTQPGNAGPPGCDSGSA